MKKRILALIFALVMIMSMTTTAFAKPSAQGGRLEIWDADGELLDIIKIEEEDYSGSIDCDHGEGCDGSVEIITPVLSEYRDIVDNLDIKELVKGTKYEDQEWVKIFEMEVIAKGCVHFPITIKFDKDDWVEGKPIIARYDVVTKQWVLVELDEETGKFSGVFEAVSPFVFFVEKDGSGATSPSTGDPMTASIAMVAIGATGLAALSRKRKH